MDLFLWWVHNSPSQLYIAHTLPIVSDGTNTVDSRANNTGGTSFDFPVLFLLAKQLCGWNILQCMWQLHHSAVCFTQKSFAPSSTQYSTSNPRWHSSLRIDWMWMTVTRLLVAILWVVVYSSFVITCMSQFHIATNLIHSASDFRMAVQTGMLWAVIRLTL